MSRQVCRQSFSHIYSLKRTNFVLYYNETELIKEFIGNKKI